ncbi:hypothetical protein BFJ72_g12457 [Fusarium proliferatum]|uniref:Reverse transcriptase RNase H-like domain-containing protein n=1 Tax=Gibberella intermedia TaxID=948311 RepID=A0A420SGI5_GIBIN|nr:hypothetical protein BFJ72_g12457 [Fusarium proliferatum]
MDFDASGLKTDGKITKYPPQTSIKPIAFFLRMLSDAETKYWATELETAGFLWTLRKTAKYINATNKPPAIMFTDHGAIPDMMRQSDIVNTTARTAVNKKLIRALEYISRFNICVIYKPGREHAVPDALSRLPNEYGQTPPDAPGELDNVPDDRPELWVAAPKQTSVLTPEERETTILLSQTTE